MSANNPVAFRPLHESHAIEQVVISVHFANVLPEEVLRAGAASMLQFKKELGGQQDITGVNLSLGPGGVAPMVLPSFQGQARFATDNAGVLLKELRLEAQAIVFRSQRYTRWNALWKEAGKYLEALLACAGDAQIASLNLQYTDKFLWQSSPGSCRSDLLLRRDSPFVAPRIFDAGDLWHCHSGRFERLNDAVQRLEIVDLDCIDEGPEQPGTEPTRAVLITTSVSDRFNRPGYHAVDFPARQALAGINEVFNNLHTQVKSVFSQIITDEISDSIGMNDVDVE
ncbi:TIGR04255 family protein [Acidovorax sp.]|uniref:TIGR04255 family protein n=1 Tax=Acidovorax sp. TaxID=1872122 RepID=UPI00391F4B87